MKSTEHALIGDISLLAIQGPDAEAFAQSQTMNDVLALRPGHWHWNGWLSAKGRVLALFPLVRVGAGELLLLVLDEPAQALQDDLRRFVFRSKVRLAVRNDLGTFAEPMGAAVSFDAPDRITGTPDGSLYLDMGSAHAPRVLRIAARGDHAIDGDATRLWRETDLRHGVPRWRSGREHGWTPHMLSLDRLKAFSTRKGCYPGQEIVARTHFLGQSKRQAWWLDGTGLSPGQAVADPDGRVAGEVVEATLDGRGALAVAALPAPGPLVAGGHPALASAPWGGLARPI
ncbi:CAF17-like 4Fe-4S cluster assembly/insertion protein YgfZ [Silanimonas algicola]